MFTGIITDLGEVRSVEAGDGGTRLAITTAYDVAGVYMGASVACCGACLTVVEKDADWLAFDVSGETLDCTTLGDWQVGSRVNLERPLKVGDELGGHIVLGHVDGVADIAECEPVGDSRRLVFTAPADLARFIAAKGSVAIDGVSLTVNRVEGRDFEVNIIPHTMRLTNLGDAAAGGRVNLEVDTLARYVARLNE
jgi:riboflavin synthase